MIMLSQVGILILLFLSLADKGKRTSPEEDSSICEKKSCFPRVGNLLIGREGKLHASSTCGLRMAERYCVVTDLNKPKNCSCGNSKAEGPDPRIKHRIESVVSNGIFRNTTKDTWWQSENGVENVTVRLDLEAEFQFTYLYMRFKSFRPAAALVERSSDYGRTWKVYRYFAADCSKYFGYVPKIPRDNLNVAYCDENFSSMFENTTVNATKGEIILSFSPSTVNDMNFQEVDVQDLLKFTNLRINFTKFHTFDGDNLLDNSTDVKKKYYYAIWEMVVGGSCFCYGHANRCVPQEGVENKPNMIQGKCECTHNTMGKNCEQCKPYFYRDPKKRPTDPESCLPCSCDSAGSLDNGICDSYTNPANNLKSGKCHCKENVEGERCDACKNGFWNLAESNAKGCEPCSCNIYGTNDDQSCDKITGQCICKRNAVGRDCSQCPEGFFGQPDTPDGCQPCDCDINGSVNNVCDHPINNSVSGKCRCKENVEEKRCDTCKYGYWNLTERNPQGCQKCSCHINGSVDPLVCHVITGECFCKMNVVGYDCSQCIPGFWGLGDTPEGCQPCNCTIEGATNRECDVFTGQCKCRENFTGRNCIRKPLDLNLIKEHHPMIPTCNCNGHATNCHFDPQVFKSTGNVSGEVCDDCKHNTAGNNCETCKPTYYKDDQKPTSHPDTCLPCDCYFYGAQDNNCNPMMGKCNCREFASGRRCEYFENSEQLYNNPS